MHHFKLRLPNTRHTFTWEITAAETGQCWECHQSLHELWRQAWPGPSGNSPVNYSEPRDHSLQDITPSHFMSQLIYAHFLESRGLGPNHPDISSCVSLRASLSIFLDTSFSSGPSLLPSQQHHPSAPEPAPYAPVNLSHQVVLHLAAIQASARSLCTMHGCVLAHLAFGNASWIPHHGWDPAPSIPQTERPFLSNILLTAPVKCLDFSLVAHAHPESSCNLLHLDHSHVPSQPCPQIESRASGPCCTVTGTRIPPHGAHRPREGCAKPLPERIN